MNSDALKGQAVPDKTDICNGTQIYIYRERVKYGKGVVGDRGKKQSTLKGKDLLSFEITVFHNGQLDHDDDHII